MSQPEPATDLVDAPEEADEPEHLDVLVVGAGLSGVCAAYHLQTSLPGKSFAVLEARESIGGTWDLFRYPGVRSDSDMPTLGFAFRPWTGEKAIADGPSILAYLHETVAEHDLGRHVRLQHRVTAASWSSEQACWTVDVEVGLDATPRRLSCGFLLVASGYYDYSGGHRPSWPGEEQFHGRWVHPQAWPEDLDVSGQDVVVIGSGATAVTLLPELARDARSVTQLQRSPTYVVSRPSRDKVADVLRRVLPERAAYAVTRAKNVLYAIYVYELAQRRPSFTKREIAKLTQSELGPDFDVQTHFTPPYDPWDQRLCLAPDSDFFSVLRDGSARIVTDTIDRFDADGIRTTSGEHLPADVVVTATGLQLRLLGGVRLDVDGEPVAVSDSFIYKGALYSGVPNFAVLTGYTNASWTLKCELIAQYVVRLLEYMARHRYDWAVPQRPRDATARPAIDLTSGYIRRSAHLLPRVSDTEPWVLRQNYLSDLRLLRFGGVDDGMDLGHAGQRAVPAAEADPREPALTGRSRSR